MTEALPEKPFTTGRVSECPPGDMVELETAAQTVQVLVQTRILPNDPSASCDEDHHRPRFGHVLRKIEVETVPGMWPVHDAPRHPG